MKLTGSIWAFLLPALLGMGFKSALFIMIFYNFHRQVPHSLVEACEIDGTTPLGAYFRIAVPLSMPGDHRGDPVHLRMVLERNHHHADVPGLRHAPPTA